MTVFMLILTLIMIFVAWRAPVNATQLSHDLIAQKEMFDRRKALFRELVSYDRDGTELSVDSLVWLILADFEGEAAVQEAATSWSQANQLLEADESAKIIYGAMLANFEPNEEQDEAFNEMIFRGIELMSRRHDANAMASAGQLIHKQNQLTHEMAAVLGYRSIVKLQVNEADPVLVMKDDDGTVYRRLTMSEENLERNIEPIRLRDFPDGQVLVLDWGGWSRNPEAETTQPTSPND